MGNTLLHWNNISPRPSSFSVLVSRRTKKAMQQKLDQVKAQVKENDKDKEFARLKRRSQIQPCSSLSNNGEITCHQGTC